MKTVPENPVANQTIKFTVYTGASGLQFYFAILSNNLGETCSVIIQNFNTQKPPIVYATEQSSAPATGMLIVTLTGGLGAGAYVVVVLGANSAYTPSGCWDILVAQ
jgi:hypothetical protein